MRKSNKKLTENEMLSIIKSECDLIFSDKLEVNKIFLSIRVATETSLKIIVSKIHPKIKVENRMLSGLIPLVYDVEEFNNDHFSFLKDAQKFGNIDAHPNLNKGDEGKAIILKMGLCYYLKWFYEDFMKLDFPEKLLEWHNHHIIGKNTNALKNDNLESNETPAFQNDIPKVEIDKIETQTIVENSNEKPVRRHSQNFNLHIKGIHVEEYFNNNVTENITLNIDSKHLDSNGNKENNLENVRNTEKFNDDIKNQKLALRAKLAIEPTNRWDEYTGSVANSIFNEFPKISEITRKTLDNWSKELIDNFEKIYVMEFNLLGYKITNYFYDDKNEFNFQYNESYLRREAIYFLIVQFLRDRLNQVYESKAGLKYDLLTYYGKYMDSKVDLEINIKLLSALASPQELFWWRVTKKYGLSLSQPVYKPPFWNDGQRFKYKIENIKTKVEQLMSTVDGWKNKFENQYKVIDLRQILL